MKQQLLKKLIAFITIGIGMFFSPAHAQIVYTDVNPDINIKCNPSPCSSTYDLDLNIDGTSDFSIVLSKTNSPCGHTNSNLSVTPNNGNATFDTIKKFGDTIDGSLVWSTTALQLLAAKTNSCVICGPYKWCWNGSTTFGSWDGQSDKYLPLKLIVGTSTYYGWTRLDVTSGGSSFTVKDYAYNSIPDQPILAGDTGSLATDIHHIKAFSSIIISPNAFQHLTRISFSLPQTEKTNVIIYDITGRIVKVLSNEMMSAGAHQLQWNATDENGSEVSAGIYLLQIQSPIFSQTEKLIVAE